MSNSRLRFEKGDWNSTCKIRPPKGIRNDQLAYYNFYWMAYGNIFFPLILQHLDKLKHMCRKFLLDANFLL